MSFIDDIQGQNTQLYPIVTIEPPDTTTSWENHYPDVIHLSTNNVSLNHVHATETAYPDLISNINFKPLLLNIPSIKESIDIESRKFKISNVSLDISNYEYGGKRFTDILSDTSLINWKVSIQFVSPSAKKFTTIFNVDNYEGDISFYEKYSNDDDFKGQITQMVYQGVIRRISHNDEKVRVELEDLTEQKAHKNLPQEGAYLGNDEGILDKYKGKPIPMVYGNVDRSPCLLDVNHTIVIENEEIAGLGTSTNQVFGETSPLSILSDNFHCPVLEEIQEDFGSFEAISDADDDVDGQSYSATGLQWELVGNRIETKDTLLKVNDALQCKLFHKPSTIRLLKPENTGVGAISWNNTLEHDSLISTLLDEDVKILTDNDYSNSINYDSGLITQEKAFLNSSGNVALYNSFSTFAKLLISVTPSLDVISSRPLKVAINGVFMPIPNKISGNNDRIYVYSGIAGTTDTDVQASLYQGTQYAITDIDNINDDCVGISRLFGFPDEDGKAGYNYNQVADVDIRYSVANHGHDDIYHHIPALFFYDFCNLGNTGVSDNGLYMIYFRGHYDTHSTSADTTAPAIDELSIGSNGNFREFDVSTLVDVEKAFSKEFYANVNGRINIYDDHPQPPSGSVDVTWTNYNIVLYAISNYSMDDMGIEATQLLQMQDFIAFGNPYHFTWTTAPQDAIQIEIDSIVDYVTTFLLTEGITPSNFQSTIEGLVQNPIDVIYDLVRRELGHHAINEADYLETREAHEGWRFGFTIDKKINSKKLIEDIAKSTKCFPKFKNDGTFGLNTIKDSYDVANDYEDATQIKELEVLSYSFKKTKPEQIYKKVTVSYHKDYAQDSYLETTDPDNIGTYDLEADPYYGIEDSKDAHLEFESDYIRDEDTANKLAKFLLEQYKNAHLLFNLKLPLQYIDLEIGDLVKFRELFGGVKAYGIDYRIIQKPNEQWYYPLFIVTSTTKNLDSVSIECMQLHNLTNSINMSWTEGVESLFPPDMNMGDNDPEGLFYFNDLETFSIFESSASDVGITPPNIIINAPAITNIYTEQSTYSLYTHQATVIDGDQDSTDITDLVVVEAMGQTWTGGESHFVGQIDADTNQIIITYSVTSPATGLTSTQIYNYNINVTTAPTITISPMGGAVTSEYEDGAFIHHVQLQGNEDVNYFEKYVYNTSPYQQIHYRAEGENAFNENADLTNFIIFGVFADLNDMVLGEDVNPPALFQEAESILNSGEGNSDEGTSHTFGVVAFVMEANHYSYEYWYVRIEYGNPNLLYGDANLDGDVNVLDVVLMVNNALGNNVFDEQQTFNADVNNDEDINVLDIVTLVNYILDN